jgi:hypothetical protein
LAGCCFWFSRLSVIYANSNLPAEEAPVGFGQNALSRALRGHTLPAALLDEEQEHDSHANFISYVLSIELTP